MTVYKVVRTDDDGSFVSLVINDRSIILEYCINKRTKPKIGKIIAFLELEDARNYAKLFYLSSTRILECSAKNVKPIKFLAGYPTRRDVSSRFTLFWKTYFRVSLKDRTIWKKVDKTMPLEVTTIKAPTGTVCVDSLTPKKVVQ